VIGRQGPRDRVDDFLERLGTAEPAAGLVDEVMIRVRSDERTRRSRRWWFVAAAAILTLVLGAGVVWIGTRTAEPNPTATLEPSPGSTPAPSLFLRTFDGISCPQAGLPRGPVTFRIDPAAAGPDQVVAVDANGEPHDVIWAVEFRGGTLADPVVRDPAGEIVARDGEPFLVTPDDDRLHGYLVCSGSNNLYVLLEGREDPDATPSPSAPPATDLGILPGTWITMADAPIQGRTDHTAVWTGTEMIVWGGVGGPATNDDQRTSDGSDGAAYAPATDTWRVLPEAPISRLHSHSAVWTGREMLIWGGLTLDNARVGGGAAYDPTSNTWRGLPAPPFAPTGTQAAVWARDQWIVVDGVPAGNGATQLNAAAYRPDSNGWDPFPALVLSSADAFSLAWTGQEVIVLTDSIAVPSAGYSLSLGDPERSWRPIAAPPSLRITAQGAETWTGTEVLVASSLASGEDRVVAYDPSKDGWRGAASPPFGLGGGSSTWTGTLAIFGLGTGGMDRRTVYDPTRDAWFGIPDAEGIHRESATQVWADDRLLLWGGFEGESILRPPGGRAFVPTALYGLAAQASDVAINGVRVEAVDASGTLTGVRTPTAAEMDAIDTSQLGADGINALAVPFGPRAIFVYWSGGPGDLAARIEIGADGRSIDLVAVPTHGDAIPLGHGVILTFGREIPAREIDLSFWDGTR
jgi:N-acetylneuraminic acid mutarotase